MVIHTTQLTTLIAKTTTIPPPQVGEARRGSLKNNNTTILLPTPTLPTSGEGAALYQLEAPHI